MDNQSLLSRIAILEQDNARLKREVASRSSCTSNRLNTAYPRVEWADNDGIIQARLDDDPESYIYVYAEGNKWGAAIRVTNDKEKFLSDDPVKAVEGLLSRIRSQLFKNQFA